MSRSGITIACLEASLRGCEWKDVSLWLLQRRCVGLDDDMTHCLKLLLLFCPSPEIVQIISFGKTGHVFVFRWTGFETNFAVLLPWVGLLSGQGQNVAVLMGQTGKVLLRIPSA